jgi:hypothetical protein
VSINWGSNLTEFHQHKTRHKSYLFQKIIAKYCQTSHKYYQEDGASITVELFSRCQDIPLFGKNNLADQLSAAMNRRQSRHQSASGAKIKGSNLEA